MYLIFINLSVTLSLAGMVGCLGSTTSEKEDKSSSSQSTRIRERRELDDKNRPILPINLRAFITDNDLDAVAQIIDDGFGVNDNIQDHTALYWATLSNKIDIVQLLLDRGANPVIDALSLYSLSSHGVGSDEIMVALINGITVFNPTITEDDRYDFRRLILDHPNVITKSPEPFRIVQEIFANDRAEFLDFAFRDARNQALVLELLRSAPNLASFSYRRRNGENTTVLAEALAGGQAFSNVTRAIVDEYRRQGLNTSQLLYDFSDNMDDFTRLVEAGADLSTLVPGIGFIPADGDWPLLFHFALYPRYVPQAKLLIERGARLDQKVKLGGTENNTLLHVASYSGNLALLRELFPAMSTSINSTNSDGDTPLHLLAEMKNSSGSTVDRSEIQGRKDAALFLKNSGADLQARNGRGRTPKENARHHATGHGQDVQLAMMGYLHSLE